MLNITATLKLTKALHDEWRKQKEINQQLMVKSYNRAGYASREFLLKRAKASFSKVGSWMKRGIVYNVKDRPELSLRLFLKWPQSKFYYPHIVKGYNRKARGGRSIWHWFDLGVRRKQRHLVPVVEKLKKHTGFGTGDAETGIEIIPYGNKRYLVFQNKAKRSKIAQTDGLIGVGVPNQRFKRIYNFARIAQRHGVRSILRQLQKNEFDV